MAGTQHAPGVRLGQVGGVPVYVAQSWLLVAALITVLFGSQLTQQLGALAYAVGVGYALALFVAVLVHEAAHAGAARVVGLPPTHIVITFWGGHTQFESEAVSPGRSVWVAVVGPLANGALALVGWLALGVVGDGEAVATRLLLAFTITNVLLAAFNLLPGLPLDGGRVLEALVWRLTGRRSTGTIAAGWGGRVVAVLAVGYAALPLLEGRQPRLITVVWAALIGAMLWSAAGQAISGARIRGRAERLDLRAVMRPVVVVAPGTPVSSLPAAGPGGPALALLDGAGQVVAVVDEQAVAAVPVPSRAGVRVESVARRHPSSAVLDASLTGDALIAAVQHAGTGQALVVDDGRVVGLVEVEHLVRALVAPTRRRAATGTP
jgi:Zn-dependent protease